MTNLSTDSRESATFGAKNTNPHTAIPKPGNELKCRRAADTDNAQLGSPMLSLSLVCPESGWARLVTKLGNGAGSWMEIRVILRRRRELAVICSATGWLEGSFNRVGQNVCPRFRDSASGRGGESRNLGTNFFGQLCRHELFLQFYITLSNKHTHTVHCLRVSSGERFFPK